MKINRPATFVIRISIGIVEEFYCRLTKSKSEKTKIMQENQLEGPNVLVIINISSSEEQTAMKFWKNSKAIWFLQSEFLEKSEFFPQLLEIF